MKSGGRRVQSSKLSRPRNLETGAIIPDMNEAATLQSAAHQLHELRGSGTLRCHNDGGSEQWRTETVERESPVRSRIPSVVDRRSENEIEKEANDITKTDDDESPKSRGL
jgi:hypothetical protein